MGYNEDSIFDDASTRLWILANKVISKTEKLRIIQELYAIIDKIEKEIEKE